MQKHNFPTIFTIFGVTGDLAKTRLIPAIYQLYQQKLLPDRFKIIGFGRRDWDDLEFRRYLDSVSSITESGFFQLFSFQKGDFDEESSFIQLKNKLDQTDQEWGMCSNKLFHLAIPPQYYENLFHQLDESKLTESCSDATGWTRVLVEKPFGHNLNTAKNLDLLLGRLFQEEQIYRIDHYLGKEMLFNILTFRFSNNLLEDSWDARGIEKIEIRLFEEKSILNREKFFDGIGALRDMGQNHALQILALLTMDQPFQFDADEIRSKRSEMLRTLPQFTTENIQKFTSRGQYEGYLDEQGVAENSSTETYFKLTTRLNNSRWNNVPITIEIGKKMPLTQKEITITFKHAEPCLFCTSDRHYQNQLSFTIEPTESIRLKLWTKKPGFSNELEENDLVLNTHSSNHANEYSRLLLDCIAGDQTLFVSTKEVESMWKFIDPIIDGWNQNIVPLDIYP